MEQIVPTLHMFLILCSEIKGGCSGFFLKQLEQPLGKNSARKGLFSSSQHHQNVNPTVVLIRNLLT